MYLHRNPLQEGCTYKKGARRECCASRVHIESAVQLQSCLKYQIAMDILASISECFIRYYTKFWFSNDFPVDIYVTIKILQSVE